MKVRLTTTEEKTIVATILTQPTVRQMMTDTHLDETDKKLQRALKKALKVFRSEAGKRFTKVARKQEKERKREAKGEKNGKHEPLAPPVRSGSRRKSLV